MIYQNKTETPTEEERALARSLIYRFVATAYLYPEPGTLTALREQEPAVPQALAVLAEFSEHQLSDHFCDLLNVAQGNTPEVLEMDYTALFGHVVQGRCPLYESEYRESDERLQQPHELSDVFAFYRAFNLTLSGEVQERVDCITVECEFMAFLCCKQAYAEEHSDATLANIALEGQRKFLREHLGRWTPAFARRIIDQSDKSFYNSLARFTLVYVTDDCKRLGVTPGKEHLKLRLPLAEADACLSCPLAEGNDEANSRLSILPEV